VAIKAAMTGHLVLSTLHTNDAASSLARLLDMEIEPFLVASGVIGILAQRLVRVICPKCKVPDAPPAAALAGLPAGSKWFRGAGCANCGQTGYKGRVGIYELLEMSEAMKDLVVARAPAHTIKEAARKAGMRTLQEDGIAKALAGITTLEEVLRVTQLQ